MNLFIRQLGIMSCILVPALTYATPRSPIELSGQFGITNLHLGNATLGVTPTETDELHQLSNVKTPELSVGINYVWPLNIGGHYHQVQFFPLIKAGLNLRYLPQEVTGEIYQYQEPDMNNYDYTLSLDSTRLMADVILDVLSVNQRADIYLLGGIGSSWTQLSYQDQPKPGIETGSLNLQGRTTTGFAYELGGGITYRLSHEANVFVEYRYAHLPSMNTRSYGSLSNEEVIVSAAHFRFFTQTIALGINWAL